MSIDERQIFRGIARDIPKEFSQTAIKKFLALIEQLYLWFINIFLSTIDGQRHYGSTVNGF
jgi:hypothetical protein